MSTTKSAASPLKAPVKSSASKRTAVKEATYLWEGKDRQGKAVRGEMRGASDSTVRAQLRRQGIQVTSVKKQKMRAGARIKDKDIALFTRQLATMMRSGVPLLQSFDIVAKGSDNPSVSKLLTEIKSDVETGTSLNAAFRKHPLYFDPLFCNLVAAGEQAGILDTLLDRLATYREKILAIQGKIKSALTYPIAIVGVAFIIVAVIMLFVIPAFKQVFESFGAELPAPTRIVIAMSDAFVEYWYIIFGVVGGSIYFGIQAFKRSERAQRTFDRLLLRAPVFGSIIRKAVMARWTRTLATMFAAGVPLVEALDSVGGASGNSVYSDATKKIQVDIAGGTSLTSSMAATQVFPNMVLQMVAIGEESGSLDSMLGKVADIFEREVDEAVDQLSSLMEPLIMVFLGGLIGGLVVAMYLPIFKLGQVV